MRMTRVAMAQFAWRLVAGALALTTALLVATTLGLATLGLVATTVTLVLGLSVVTGAGFTHAVAFMVARDPASGRTVDRALAFALVASIAIGALVAMAGPLLFPSLPVLWGHAAIALPFVQVGQLGLGLHQGLGSYRGYAVTYMAQPLAAFCIAIIAAAVAMGVDADGQWSGALVLVPFVVQAMTVIPAWLALRRDVPGEPIRTLVSYTARIYPSAVAHYLSYRLDLVLVSALLGATAAGIYSLALNGVDAVARIGQAAATVLFPRFAVMREAEDPSRLVRRTAVVAGILSLIASVALASVVLIAGRSLGPQVRAVGVLLAILTLAGGAVSAWTVTASYLAARDRLGAVARVNVALLVTSLALYLTLIPTIGVYGAAIGTSVGLVVAALMGYREVASRRSSGVGRRP